MNIYTKSLDGHRKEYLNFWINEFGGERSSIMKIIFSKKVSVFLMIEEGFFIFLLVSIARLIQKKVTIGLLFRPGPLENVNSIKLTLKKLALKLLRKSRFSCVLTILPHYLFNKINHYSKDWIYDFQMWDLSDSQYFRFKSLKSGVITSPICEQILLKAKGRKVVVSFGIQNTNKCTTLFMSTFSNNFQIRDNFLFVSAGAQDSNNKDQIEYFNKMGGLVIDRHIKEAEIIDLYSAADIMWALYSKTYDQASGILGRSIQLGVLTIVRKNSLIDKLCSNESIDILPADEYCIIEVLTQFSSVKKHNLTTPPKSNENIISSFKEHSKFIIANLIK